MLVMKTTVKYLVSQHFGRVRAIVEGGNVDATTTVRLSGEAGGFDITFNVDEEWQDVPEGEDKIETLVRCAMAQATRMLRRGCSMPHADELDLDITPWIGDVLDEPYGGCTIGLTMLKRKRLDGRLPAEERRRNKAGARIIQRAIHLHQLHGAHASASFMKANAVPVDIIDRVVKGMPYCRR